MLLRLINCRFIIIPFFIFYFTFLTREKTLVAQKIIKGNYEICLVVNLFWPVVINKTIIITSNIIIINVPLPTALLCLCCGIWIRQHRLTYRVA